MDYYISNGQLCHAGVKGMRWGQRLYQNKDGSLTPLGRIRYRKKQAAALEKRKQTLEAKKKAASDAKEHEEAKQRALKSGSASDLLKFRGELTKQEMDAAWSRIQWERNMSDIAAKEVAAGKSKADKFFEGVGKATSYAETGLKAYNTVANIVNAFGKGKLMPKVDVNITSGNRKERKAEEKEQKKEQEAKKKRAQQEAQRETKQKERAAKKAKKAEKAEEVDYDIYDAPNSKKSSSSKKRSDDVIIIDDYEVSGMNTTVSNLPAVQVSTGKAAVDDILKRLPGR